MSPDAVAALNAPTPTATPQIVIEITATVTANRLNVRRGPGPEYDKVRELSNGQNITLIGRNADGTWIKLNTTDQQWINSRYTAVEGDLLELPITFTEIGEWDVAGRPTGVRAVAETVLRIRGGPGSQYRQLSNPDTLDTGAVVDVVGISADGLFYKVNIGNRSGWINAQYVRLTGNTNAEIPVIVHSGSPCVERSNCSRELCISLSSTTCPLAARNIPVGG